MPAFNFSTQGINPGYGSLPGLPIGKHPVVINSVSLEATSTGTGGKMVLNLEVIDGPAKGAKGFEQLTLQHQNPVTVRIAQEQLTSICIVAGLPGGIQNTTEELHGKTFVVEVAPQKDKPQYTEVVNVFDMNGNTAKDILSGNGGGNANQGGGNGSFGNNNQQQQQQQQNNQGGGNNAGAGNGGGWGGNTGGAADNGNNGGAANNGNNGGNNGGGWTQGADAGNNGGGNGGGNPGWGAR